MPGSESPQSLPNSPDSKASLANAGKSENQAKGLKRRRTEEGDAPGKRKKDAQGELNDPRDQEIL